MFELVTSAPRDAILGLTEAFRADANPHKINLGVGVYQDSNGSTPILATVREAGHRVLEGERSKSYLPISGDAQYCQAALALMFGEGAEALQSGRAVACHTPGGTGALRVVADFLKQNFPSATLWMTDPTWANHPTIFDAAGVVTKKFAYFDPETNGLAFEAALEAIRQMPAGDAILLHGCCHNPTGIDPTNDQWRQLADAVYERKLLPIIDFAYQGFADGIEEDASGLREFCRPGAELAVCSSFSKNFGLYNERVGAVSFVARDAAAAETVLSQVKRCIRANYSNPPAHGAQLVRTILADAELKARWVEEVAGMRDRINGMRQLLVEKLAEKGVPGDYSFINHQRGMFSFTGLTPAQVEALQVRHSIYIVGSGRINVAGVTEQNVDRLCEAIAEVVSG